MKNRIDLLEGVVDAVGSRFERDAARIVAEGAGGPPGVTSLSKRAATMDIMAGGSGRGEGRLFELVEDYGDAESKALMNQRRAQLNQSPAVQAGLSARNMEARAAVRRGVGGEDLYRERLGFVNDELARRSQLPISANYQPSTLPSSVGGTPMPSPGNRAPAPIAPGRAIYQTPEGGIFDTPVNDTIKTIKKKSTQKSNQATAGSEVGSKQAADITGYAGSMMGGLAAVGVGAGVGGVTSYATGGEFGKGAVAGGMVAGGAYLGMSTMATNSKAINAAVAQGGEGFGAGVMGAMQGANQVIGGASVAARRAALMGGAGLAGLTFGGNRRSHRRGFNQSRGSRI